MSSAATGTPNSRPRAAARLVSGASVTITTGSNARPECSRQNRNSASALVPLPLISTATRAAPGRERLKKGLIRIVSVIISVEFIVQAATQLRRPL